MPKDSKTLQQGFAARLSTRLCGKTLRRDFTTRLCGKTLQQGFAGHVA
jgi:hypothetical protein